MQNNQLARGQSDGYPSSSPLPLITSVATAPPNIRPISPGIRTSTSTSSPMNPMSQIVHGNSFRANATPISPIAPTNANFRHQLAQQIPAQIFAAGNPPMAVPLSPNILQMAGNMAPGQIFATQQVQPIFIGGQQAAIVTTVPNPGNMAGNPGQMQLLTPTSVTGMPPGIFPAVSGIPTIQTNLPFLSATSPVVPPCGPTFPDNGNDMPTDLSKKSSPIPLIKPKEENYIGPVCGSEKRETINTSDRNPVEGDVQKSERDEKKDIKPHVEIENIKYSNIDIADYNEDGVPIEYNEPEFVWEEYLQETGSSAVPPTAFKHVEYSLESGFCKGMKLEVPNKCNLGTYWVASVIMTCGPLLRLRYDGYEEDSSADFWCDLMTSEIHPIGWCAQNNQILQPPEAIKDKFDDWREFLVRSLTGARTAPSYLLDKTTGITPIDQLKQGMRLELQHPISPMDVWLVKIIENVGGRLYLRFEGADSASHDFWLFYLNHRLHPIGWTKANGYRYKPPQELGADHTEEEWMEILENALREAEQMLLPIAIFKDQIDIVPHKFQAGWKLEALNPITRNQICPATVRQILDSKYFVVEIDDLQCTDPYGRIRFSCHAKSRCIFPAQWCLWKGLKLTPPKGWYRSEFSWQDYLEQCEGMAAPESCFSLEKTDHEFERGKKLEAVNPENHNQICAATITKIVEPLIWVHLDNSAKMVASHIEHVDSHNLFPVGWCESNGYQLKPPRKTGMKLPSKRVAVVQPEKCETLTEKAYTLLKQGEGDASGTAMCPKIYYNHQCFSGPYLSKGRIAELPKCVGPGPITLVLKEVLSMLINVAYKPCRVLREIQLEGKPNPNKHRETLKAKYKGKSYRAIVELCQNTEQLEDFCRQVCIKLECCPNLISPHAVNGSCPENCSQLTKTKYTDYYGKKKRKIGRPPGGHSNLENGPKKPGKRRRKRRWHMLQKEEESNVPDQNEEDIPENNEDDKESVDSSRTNESSDRSTTSSIIERRNKIKKTVELKRKYTHHLPPPSDIKTRGAKLPKYSFERKTHKKVMITSTNHRSPTKLHVSSSHNKESVQIKQEVKEPKEKKPSLRLDTNPLQWTVSEVVKFIKSTDCSHLARAFKEQEIDGQALLLLTLPTVQEYLELKLGPAIKLCHQIERVKIAFYEQYAK